MKTIASKVALLLVVLASVSACQTPSAKWAAARDTLTVTTTGLTAAAKSGRLSDKQIIAADAFVQAARAGLRNAEGYLPAGGPAFESYLAAIDALLAKVAEYQAQKLKPPQE